MRTAKLSFRSLGIFSYLAPVDTYTIDYRITVESVFDINYNILLDSF